jgi:hypothetical protein
MRRKAILFRPYSSRIPARLAIGVLGAVLTICSPFAAYAGAVWLAGVDAVNAADRQRLGQSSSGSNDFMGLFKPNAPWRQAAAKIQIFKVSQRFLDASTDDQLKAVIDDLRRRHIALGFSAQIMVASRECGAGIPGSSSKASIQLAADRVKRLGGTIDYVAFDSPVAFGHFNILNKPNGCTYSITDLVKNIAPQIQTLKAAFPDIKFGDVESLNSHTVGWINAYLNFAKQFQAQTGEPLSFLQADIIWFDNWRPQLVEWKTRLEAAGIYMGARR